MNKASHGPARFELAPERAGLTMFISGRDKPGEGTEVSLSRSETARIVELMCKNAGLPAPWTGAAP